jgi:hypothetical protein
VQRQASARPVYTNWHENPNKRDFPNNREKREVNNWYSFCSLINTKDILEKDCILQRREETSPCDKLLNRLYKKLAHSVLLATSCLSCSSIIYGPSLESMDFVFVWEGEPGLPNLEKTCDGAAGEAPRPSRALGKSLIVSNLL